MSVCEDCRERERVCVSVGKQVRVSNCTVGLTTGQAMRCLSQGCVYREECGAQTKGMLVHNCRATNTQVCRPIVRSSLSDRLKTKTLNRCQAISC